MSVHNGDERVIYIKFGLFFIIIFVTRVCPNELNRHYHWQAHPYQYTYNHTYVLTLVAGNIETLYKKQYDDSDTRALPLGTSRSGSTLIESGIVNVI